MGGKALNVGSRGFVLTAAPAALPLPLLVLTGVIDTQALMKHHGYLHKFLSRPAALFVHD